ncbi:serine/threonine-protein kinase [Polyangium aurulentum]|uniref:serine/threonine-protein kinase n=1 Tax=Polyangium aurulentum TaxID=2567896 RepID=UPI0010AEE23A|nr:serine/threonine-protein kinase [Polyangium aurulentum]UQA62499.1 protein kinase [Polyangium aurulentum]
MECPACHHPNIDGARFCAKCGAPLPAVASEQDPLIGAIVGGRYRITGILGEGGMGRVYTAEQQMGTTVRKVAVKTLLAQYAKDPQVLARFMRECGTVAELEHPNTIKVYDFGQTDTGELYIAMELLNGTSLEDAIANEIAQGRAMSPERVDRILAQVCGSLQEAHDKGIVHRDLKPANIFLTRRAGEEDYVKVLDFGIAKRSERPDSKEQKLTQQGTVLGTPPYMSPEQFRGQELDARSDIYSLAVVAYEMLTGKLPFDADTPWAWATQHLTAQPSPFEVSTFGAQVPHKMKSAIMRALEKDKLKRQGTVREFHEDLTVGAPRASIFGGSPMAAQQVGQGTGTGMMQGYPSMHNTPMPSGSMPSRPGGTQLGEPIFVPPSGAPQAPAGRTMLDSGQHGASMGMTPGPVHAMPHASVPTGGGQVFPAPPPAASRPNNSKTPLIAGIAVLGVLGLVGTIVALKSGGSSTDKDANPIILPSSAPTETKVASDPPPTVDTSTATSPSAAPTSQPTAAGGTQAGSGSGSGTTKPAVDPKAAAACDAAMQLALGGNTVMAVNQYRSCSGPKQAAARSAIGGSAQREVKAKGCAAKGAAQAAASIGESAAKNSLPASCK